MKNGISKRLLPSFTGFFIDFIGDPEPPHLSSAFYRVFNRVLFHNTGDSGDFQMKNGISKRLLPSFTGFFIDFIGDPEPLHLSSVFYRVFFFTEFLRSPIGLTVIVGVAEDVLFDVLVLAGLQGVLQPQRHGEVARQVVRQRLGRHHHAGRTVEDVHLHVPSSAVQVTKEPTKKRNTIHDASASRCPTGARSSKIGFPFGVSLVEDDQVDLFEASLAANEKTEKSFRSHHRCFIQRNRKKKRARGFPSLMTRVLGCCFFLFTEFFFY